MNQHTYVAGVLAYYKENDIVPGDPNEGHWEEAHYPAPKGLGDETILLIHGHHQVQGVLQSAEYNRRCYFTGHVKKHLNKCWETNWFELWNIYDRMPGANTGKTMSEEQKQKLRFITSNRPGNNTGKTFSAEWRANMSKARKGKKLGPQSDQHRANVSTGAKSRPRLIALHSGLVSHRGAVARHLSSQGLETTLLAPVPKPLIEHMSDNREANLAIWTAYQRNPGLL